jgi:hypothetical protein
MEQAACRGQADKMFPKGHKDVTYVTEARKICRACPVRPECTEYTLGWPATDLHGMWAGMTPRQVGREQQRRGITPTRLTISALWDIEDNE